MFELEQDYLNTLDSEARISMEDYLRKQVYEKVMFCPICKEQLVLGTPKEYETLSDHVCDPNGDVPKRHTFVCVNKWCPASKLDMFWDPDGDFYSGILDSRYYKFVDGNTAAFGSFQRKCNIEICKHNEDFDIIKWDKFIHVRVKWEYKANRDGVIIKKRPRVSVYGSLGLSYGHIFDFYPFGVIKDQYK